MRTDFRSVRGVNIGMALVILELANAENVDALGQSFLLNPQLVRLANGRIDTREFNMENIINFVASQDWLAWVGAVTALLTAVIAVCQLIPGDQPEKSLQAVVDFLSRFSRK